MSPEELNMLTTLVANLNTLINARNLLPLITGAPNPTMDSLDCAIEHLSFRVASFVECEEEESND